MIDCHAHIFNTNHTPDHFFGLKLSLSQKLLKWCADSLSIVIPGQQDSLENIAKFSKHFSQTIEQNYLDLMAFYPKDTIVCLLLMDMTEIKGEIKEKYQAQIDAMLGLKTCYEKVRLFLHLNPNKPIENLFNDYVLSGKFDGVKLYPPLNSKPTHEALQPIFAECEKRQIPITSHCGPFGVSSSNFFNMSKGEYANPKYWRKVLEKFPHLKVNLAHFGEGVPSWQTEIVSLCLEYPNVYTDTSFTIGSLIGRMNIDYWCDHSEMIDKILYGSDFYMTDLIDWNITKIVADLKYKIGDENFIKITETNPKRFLEKI
jgi:uncharacterized protein